ncbi:hypothetical protein [Fulvivirga sedimenti]|uniref:N-acetyltransferase domain-containing protein n=1 Tax=Fulvivirga sedimenti TaxID=2879465 RepID=A0A9X1KXG8_9BACT|nr:hypothetical protein [Fulvivirga sedimenti]MCA6074989.1 hypothetical protein [Fulvivirga sedimenti]MCA6076166.1 hypothetical protein [Fulvivirga sedimenti]MCA6077294.1 hypothetical protein [Fulvivirga sedimenti]
MRKATKSDQAKVVDIISKSFAENPGVNWMFKKGGNHARMMKSLASYVFMKGLVRNGVYISSNEKGVAVCYQFNETKFSLTEILHQLIFVFHSFDFRSIPKILKRESYRKKIRPASGEYLYFWFLGVLPGGKNAGFELKNAIFNEARRKNLPIYLETAVARNQQVYERLGFKTYHYWENTAENIKFWFMKWEPGASVNQG